MQELPVPVVPTKQRAIDVPHVLADAGADPASECAAKYKPNKVADSVS